MPMFEILSLIEFMIGLVLLVLWRAERSRANSLAARLADLKSKLPPPKPARSAPWWKYGGAR